MLAGGESFLSTCWEKRGGRRSLNEGKKHFVGYTLTPAKGGGGLGFNWVGW